MPWIYIVFLAIIHNIKSLNLPKITYSTTLTNCNANEDGTLDKFLGFENELFLNIEKYWPRKQCSYDGEIIIGPDLTAIIFCGTKVDNEYRPREQRCLEGQIVNIEMLSCQYPPGNGFAVCYIPHRDCPEIETKLLPHPNDEFYMNYLYCIKGGGVIVARCQENHYFNKEAKQCVSNETVITVLTDSMCELLTHLKCTKPGVFPIDSYDFGSKEGPAVGCQGCYYRCRIKNSTTYDLVIECPDKIGRELRFTEQKVPVITGPTLSPTQVKNDTGYYIQTHESYDHEIDGTQKKEDSGNLFEVIGDHDLVYSLISGVVNIPELIKIPPIDIPKQSTLTKSDNWTDHLNISPIQGGTRQPNITISANSTLNMDISIVDTENVPATNNVSNPPDIIHSDAPEYEKDLPIVHTQKVGTVMIKQANIGFDTPAPIVNVQEIPTNNIPDASALSNREVSNVPAAKENVSYSSVQEKARASNQSDSPKRNNTSEVGHLTESDFIASNVNISDINMKESPIENTPGVPEQAYVTDYEETSRRSISEERNSIVSLIHESINKFFDILRQPDVSKHVPIHRPDSIMSELLPSDLNITDIDLQEVFTSSTDISKKSDSTNSGISGNAFDIHSKKVSIQTSPDVIVNSDTASGLPPQDEHEFTHHVDYLESNHPKSDANIPDIDKKELRSTTVPDVPRRPDSTGYNLSAFDVNAFDIHIKEVPILPNPGITEQLDTRSSLSVLHDNGSVTYIPEVPPSTSPDTPNDSKRDFTYHVNSSQTDRSTSDVTIPYIDKKKLETKTVPDVSIRPDSRYNLSISNINAFDVHLKEEPNLPISDMTEELDTRSSLSVLHDNASVTYIHEVPPSTSPDTPNDSKRDFTHHMNSPQIDRSTSDVTIPYIDKKELETTHASDVPIRPDSTGYNLSISNVNAFDFHIKEVPILPNSDITGELDTRPSLSVLYDNASVTYIYEVPPSTSPDNSNDSKRDFTHHVNSTQIDRSTSDVTIPCIDKKELETTTVPDVPISPDSKRYNLSISNVNAFDVYIKEIPIHPNSGITEQLDTRSSLSALHDNASVTYIPEVPPSTSPDTPNDSKRDFTHHVNSSHSDRSTSDVTIPYIDKEEPKTTTVPDVPIRPDSTRYNLSISNVNSFDVHMKEGPILPNSGITEELDTRSSLSALHDNTSVSYIPEVPPSTSPDIPNDSKRDFTHHVNSSQSDRSTSDVTIPYKEEPRTTTVPDVPRRPDSTRYNLSKSNINAFDVDIKEVPILPISGITEELDTRSSLSALYDNASVTYLPEEPPSTSPDTQNDSKRDFTHHMNPSQSDRSISDVTIPYIDEKELKTTTVPGDPRRSGSKRYNLSISNAFDVHIKELSIPPISDITEELDTRSSPSALHDNTSVTYIHEVPPSTSPDTSNDSKRDFTHRSTSDVNITYIDKKEIETTIIPDVSIGPDSTRYNMSICNVNAFDVHIKEVPILPISDITEELDTRPSLSVLYDNASVTYFYEVPPSTSPDTSNDSKRDFTRHVNSSQIDRSTSDVTIPYIDKKELETTTVPDVPIRPDSKRYNLSISNVNAFDVYIKEIPILPNPGITEQLDTRSSLSALHDNASVTYIPEVPPSTSPDTPNDSKGDFTHHVNSSQSDRSTSDVTIPYIDKEESKTTTVPDVPIRPDSTRYNLSITNVNSFDVHMKEVPILPISGITEELDTRSSLSALHDNASVSYIPEVPPSTSPDIPNDSKRDFTHHVNSSQSDRSTSDVTLPYIDKKELKTTTVPDVSRRPDSTRYNLSISNINAFDVHIKEVPILPISDITEKIDTRSSLSALHDNASVSYIREVPPSTSSDIPNNSKRDFTHHVNSSQTDRSTSDVTIPYIDKEELKTTTVPDVSRRPESTRYNLSISNINAFDVQIKEVPVLPISDFTEELDTRSSLSALHDNASVTYIPGGLPPTSSDIPNDSKRDFTHHVNSSQTDRSTSDVTIPYIDKKELKATTVSYVPRRPESTRYNLSITNVNAFDVPAIHQQGEPILTILQQPDKTGSTHNEFDDNVYVIHIEEVPSTTSPDVSESNVDVIAMKKVSNLTIPDIVGEPVFKGSNVSAFNANTSRVQIQEIPSYNMTNILEQSESAVTIPHRTDVTGYDGAEVDDIYIHKVSSSIIPDLDVFYTSEIRNPTITSIPEPPDLPGADVFTLNQSDTKPSTDILIDAAVSLSDVKSSEIEFSTSSARTSDIFPLKETTTVASTIPYGACNSLLDLPCPSVGSFRYNGSCNKYYQCVESKPCNKIIAVRLFQCSKCFKFNAQKMKCDLPENVPECTYLNWVEGFYHTQYGKHRFCTGPGKFPVPENCRMFYDCVKDYNRYLRVVRWCPNEMKFNDLTKSCEKEHKCPSTYSECENGRAYDKYSCEKLYYCDVKSGKGIALHCPESYVFFGVSCIHREYLCIDECIV